MCATHVAPQRPKFRCGARAAASASRATPPSRRPDAVRAARSPLLPGPVTPARHRHGAARARAAVAATALLVLLLLGAGCPRARVAGEAGFAACGAEAATKQARKVAAVAVALDWQTVALFRVARVMRVIIALSLALGALLGVGVGVLSGLEQSVVIGMPASMALGCVFVMSFAIALGVNVLRAACFAAVVSACLPAHLGLVFGLGCLPAVFMGLENHGDVGEKTQQFFTHFSDFARVVLWFTLEICEAPLPFILQFRSAYLFRLVLSLLKHILDMLRKKIMVREIKTSGVLDGRQFPDIVCYYSSPMRMSTE